MFSARGGFQGGSAADGDPYWANVELLLTARTGTLVDAAKSAAIGVTSGVGAVIYSSPVNYNPYSFGQSSFARWSVAAYSPRNASGQFTHETWWRSFGTSAATAYEVAWMINPINPAIGNIIGQIGSIANANKWSINSIGGTNYNFTTASAYDQTWHHVCFTRDASNVIRFFYDGVLYGTTVTSSQTFNFGNQMIFGGAGGSDNASNGYWDDYRLTIGVCRYTTTFTQPVGPLPIG